MLKIGCYFVSTVHGEIVDLRLTFMVCRDMLKTGHMIRCLKFD